jgi:hypothetical protein
VVEIQRTQEQPVAYRVRDLKGKMLGLLPIVWVGILLSVFHQFVCINVIFYFSTSLCSVGFGAGAAFWNCPRRRQPVRRLRRHELGTGRLGAAR